MDSVNLLQVNNKYSINNKIRNGRVQAQIRPKVGQVKNGDKKLLAALVGLGAIATADVGAILAAKNSKTPAKAPSDINFGNGIAKEEAQRKTEEYNQKITDFANLLYLQKVKYSINDECFEAIKSDDTFNKELSAQDKKNVYNLVKTRELLEKNANIEAFPIVIGENQNELLNLYIEQNAQNINNDLFQKVLKRNLKYTKLANQNAQLIYDTPLNAQKALCSANAYIKEFPVIDLSKIANDADVSCFGFPVGTKKKDLRFYVYMIEDKGTFGANVLSQNLDRILEDMDSNNKIWSKSLLSSEHKNTFKRRHYGFITEPKIGNMYTTRVDGSYTGYDKTKSAVLKNVFDSENAYETEALTKLPNAVRQQLNISESGYEELVRKLKQTGNIFAQDTPEFIEIEGRQIEFSKIKEAVLSAQDKLFDIIKAYNSTGNNEILDEMLNIKALFIKSTDGYEPPYRYIDNNDEYIADFAAKFKAKTGKDLPIIIL